MSKYWTAPGPSPPEGVAARRPGPPPEVPATPLNIVIVGAGISGLTAAISLRREGHRVKIFEQSQFSNEIGAAIHVGPNVTRVLKRLGYDEKRLRGVPCAAISLYDGITGNVIFEDPHEKFAEAYGSPWYLSHRVDLHNELKLLALGEDGDGPPAELHLSSAVESVQAEEGIVTLENGEKYTCDLIVAADGIRSRVREQVFDPTKPTPTGEAAYRFIIDMSEVANDPECLPIDAKDGKCRIAITPEKRVVMYPCRDYSLLNFVCIHKDKYGQPTEGWDSKSSVEAVLSTYSNFSPQILNMLKKASNVKCWQLLQRDLIDSWVKGKVVLIGDAAHPMLPHLGQGAGQGIEDGACLGPIFKWGTKQYQVSQALKLWQQVRKTRATTVQELSASQAAGKATISPKVVQAFTFGHDCIEYAKYARSSEVFV